MKLPSQVPVGDGSPPASQGGSVHWLYSWASKADDLGAKSASTTYSQVTLGCGFTSLRLSSQLVKQNPTLFTASITSTWSKRLDPDDSILLPLLILLYSFLHTIQISK